jgi:hypothetical protein
MGFGKALMRFTIGLVAGMAYVVFSPHAGTGAEQDPVPSLRHLITAKNEETRRDVRADEGLESTINRVGRAFELGDANVLEGCLVPRKIYLSLKATGEEAGYYGKSQVRFMFQKLFRERSTDSFLYDSEEIEMPSSGTAYVRATWTYAAPEADDVETEHLRLKLEKTKDDWSVSEIRTQHR